MQKSMFLCIDLKSFYASVECVERGLDPMTTNLVVADPERSKNTICLAITPAMKKLGIRNRCRVNEIPANVEYITAQPRMQFYIDYAAEIYGIYLKYISKDDIHVYSIDEAFLDVTHYLSLYKMTAKELGQRIMQDVLAKTGIENVKARSGKTVYALCRFERSARSIKKERKADSGKNRIIRLYERRTESVSAS